ncbi:hypothetical protein ACXGQW_04835 [Wenyingzhuangia sp. IMCC45533]
MKNLLLLLLLVVGCNQVDDKIRSYKEFYPSGLIKIEGSLLYDSIQIGEWKVYDSLGNVKRILNYKNVNNSTRLNTYWDLNSNKDTIGGIGYTIIGFKKQIRLDEANPIWINLTYPKYSFNSKIYFMYPSKGEERLDSIFSNMNDIRYDTILNLKDKGYDYQYGNLKIFVKVYSDSIMDGHVRGILKESDTIEGKPYENQYFIDLDYEVLN